MKVDSPFLVPITNEISLVTIPVEHFRSCRVITNENVSFRMFRDGDRFKAVPQISADERRTAGITEELVFVYRSQVITSANNTSDEAMNVIKNITLELEAQELL
ncbi:hypothetical protein [Flavisolibacter ginsenosidimutans]|uniref:Uncharacterized protein n=1 Tax=Flavisolibacter ginsenosidimutans TaxID=661481 RepID=A0A5B8UP22_9BACT|nr:hypothetical protein [Flavisolibacter ginsenosidimutans]QEC57979.1 hypothetical protein FSB75_19390 [Flavisolibacter ginsenosidimutans]